MNLHLKILLVIVVAIAISIFRFAYQYGFTEGIVVAFERWTTVGLVAFWVVCIGFLFRLGWNAAGWGDRS